MRNYGNNGRIRLLILSLALLGITSSSCFFTNPFAETPAQEHAVHTIDVGAEVILAAETVAPSGGVISVYKSGDPLDGLEIDVTAGAYQDTRKFDISYSPISGHDFGDNFNPATPLISVDNGGGYSAELMLVSIPVKIPDGKFAMGFFYDKEAGTLEGIPVVDEDATHITIATRHFSDFLISLIDTSVLEADIDSAFRPGVDDWQFENLGSYIAPNGHCYGQSVSAMWYYCEKARKGAAHLYGLYDNNSGPKTPDLWLDDSLGYRLASMVQVDGVTSRVLEWIDLHLSETDELTYRAFAYAILLTGEPQYVKIVTRDGAHRHAMIVYRVAANTLYIADPNYPGSLDRKIELVGGKFKPYNSGDNKEAIDRGEGEEYTWIFYFAKTVYSDWGEIGRRWEELEATTIGTIGDGHFPTYVVRTVDDGGNVVELKDDHRVKGKALTLDVVDASGNGLPRGVFRDGNQVSQNDSGKYELQPGNNRLGIAVFGRVNGKQKYIDFKYVNVVSEPEETPQPAPPAEPGPTDNPAAEGAGGGWYLEGEPVIEKEQFVNTECYYQSLNVTNGSASGAITWSDCGQGPCGGTYTGSMTWTPPPAYMKPGTQIDLSMTAETTVQNTCGSRSIGSGGWIKAEGTTIVKAIDETSPSASGAYTVPDGSAGQKLQMWATVGVANLHGTVYYNYVYQSTGPGAAAVTPPASPTASDWSGQWQCGEWGLLTLTQSGNQVSGTYPYQGGRLMATATGDNGNTLVGTWSEDPTHQAPNDAGDITFTISADGNSFTGQWRYGSSGDWKPWNGQRQQ